MKVVQLLPELNEGGVERGTVELNRELVKRGVESTVISAGGKLAQQVNVDGGKHVTLDVCSKNPLTAPLRVRQLRQLLRQVSPDVIHARSRVPAWLAFLANKPLQIPFVTTVHGFNSVNRYSRVMTYGDRVICVSNAIKKYVQQHYNVPDEKIVVIPRGVDLDLFGPMNTDQEFIDQFRQRYDLEKKYVVTSVGRITQLKDYATFIRGVVQAKEKVANIAGLVVGGVRQDKKDYFASLQRLVQELGAQDYIHFTGSQAKIPEIYALSDVVVICSKKPESFGRTAAEALAMNVPVIATGHGGVLDVVSEGVNGFLFQKGEPKELAEKITLCKQGTFKNLRLEIERQFSLGKMVVTTLGLYKSMHNSANSDD